MCIKKILESQAVDIGNYVDTEAARLVQLRWYGFSSDPFEKSPTVCLLEDRDRYAAENRSDRFHLGDLSRALREATGLLIVVYLASRGRRTWRLGGVRQLDAHSIAAGSLLAAGGLSVVVKTTSDRVRFWTEEGVRRGRGRYQPMWLDAQGVNVVRTWGVAA